MGKAVYLSEKELWLLRQMFDYGNFASEDEDDNETAEKIRNKIKKALELA